MKRSGRWMIPIGLWIIANAAAATATAADFVIAVIDPTRIEEQSPQYEAARAQLQQEVAEREQMLAEQQEQISQLQQELARNEALMREEEVQRLQADIRNRGRKVRYAQEELREDLSLRKNQLRIKLGKQVEEVVTELAREESIDLIVSESLVFYASKRIDISDKVIERLRQKFESK